MRLALRRVFTLERLSSGCGTSDMPNWEVREKRCEIAEKRCGVGHPELGGPSSRCRSFEKIWANAEFRYRKVATPDLGSSINRDYPLPAIMGTERDWKGSFRSPLRSVPSVEWERCVDYGAISLGWGSAL